MGLGDAKDHLHLHRNNSHGCERFREQLQGAVEDGIVENHAAIIGHRGRGSADLDGRQRNRGHAVLDGSSLLPAKLQVPPQRGEKLLFLRGHRAAGLADTEGQFVREHPVLPVVQCGDNGFERELAHQNLPGKVGEIFRADFAGETMDVLALFAGFVPVGEGCKEADGEKGVLPFDFRGNGNIHMGFRVL